MLKFAGLSYKHSFIIDLFESRAKKKKTYTLHLVVMSQCGAFHPYPLHT